jgi:endonuclease/exonuclease/phosphatase family metal-dependent hydrolase
VFGPFRVQAPEARAPQPHPDPRDLERAAGTAVRVLAWNVGDRTPLLRPEPFRRVLRAADPDVVLLDELNPALDEAGVRALLPGGEEWTLILGTGGGRQRTAVASRLPLQAVPALARVPWPDSVAALAGVPLLPQVRSDLASAADDGVSAVGGVVTVGPLRVLFVALDLACCGLAGSGEDRARAIAASAIHSAIRAALDAGEADAAVIGGDINLVGSRLPLETLRMLLDRAGGDLAAADLLTPDGRSYSTWRSPGPFPPGRLDWVLFPESVLEQVGGLVLDAALLAATERARLGLEATDTQVTDHLPLVVDFALRQP